MNAWQKLLIHPSFHAACMIAAWLAAAICLAVTWSVLTREVQQNLLSWRGLQLMYLFAACTAATICLIALWAGSSRGHWFPRTMVPCLALAAFIPIRAHELLVFFALVTVEIVAVFLVARMWTNYSAKGNAGECVRTGVTRRPLSFGLGDGMLATAVAALAIWILKDLVQVELMIRWVAAVNASLLVTLVALLAWRVAQGASWLVWLGLCIFAVTATAFINGWKLTDCLYASHLFSLGSSATTSYADFQLAWIGTALFAFWIIVLSLATRNAFSAGAHPAKRWPARAALATSLLVYVPLGWLYWTLTTVAQIPSSPQTTGNIYPQVVVLSVQSQSVSPGAAQAIHSRLIKLLDEPGHVPLDRAQIINDPAMFQRFATQRQILALSRVFDLRAEALHRRQQHDQAAISAMAMLKLARLQWRGGVAVDVRVAAAIEAEGHRELARDRDELSMSTVREAVYLLESLDTWRESADVIVQRTDACERLAQRWRITLERRIFWEGLFGTAGQRHPDRSSVEEALKNSQSISRLLQTDLAARLFRHDRGRLPATLEELVPRYIPAVPTDPYSGQPLVYRLDPDGVVLYAVGRDGKDNGGQTPTGWRGMLEPNTDWSLDWFVSQ